MIQVRRYVEIDGRRVEVWLDRAAVSVPAKTKRKTVVEKAMERIGAGEDGEAEDGKITLRVLPSEAATEIPVEWEQPPPQLRIAHHR